MTSRTIGLVTIGFALAFSAGLAAPVFADEPSTTNTASSKQLDELVADILAHKQACDKVTPAQADAYKRCQNEQTQLADRQKRLGFSDKDVNDKIGTRGWRWNNQLPACPGDPRCR